MTVHERRIMGVGTLAIALTVLGGWSFPRVAGWTEARQTLAIEAVARVARQRALLAATTSQRSDGDEVLRLWTMSGTSSLATIDFSRRVHELADRAAVSATVHRERERSGVSGMTHLTLRITVRGRGRAVLTFLSELERASPRAAVQRFVIAPHAGGLASDAGDMRAELVAEALVTDVSVFTASW